MSLVLAFQFGGNVQEFLLGGAIGAQAVVDFQHASIRNPRHLRRAAKITRQVRTAGTFGDLRLILQGFGANLDVVEGQLAGNSLFQRDVLNAETGGRAYQVWSLLAERIVLLSVELARGGFG